MSRLTLHHAAILPPDALVHMARATLTRKRPKGLHDHDFHELLWVQNGVARQHLPDGSEDLAEGDVVFVQPHHAHALQARADETMVVSVAFHPDLIAGLGAAHPRLAGRLFWAPSDRPVRQPRDFRQLADLNHAALRLERSARDRTEAEAFLLPLCAALLDAAQPLPPDAPGWLVTACAAARDPAVFRDGAAGLARVAGRAHPHVSRTVRKYLGQTPSDYVNAQRMAYAARRLTGTGDTLAEIAADCGIPNLSHFHKLFRAAHGQTPAQYRQSLQRNMVQPT